MTTEYRYRAWSRREGAETAGAVRASSLDEARELVDDDDLVVFELEAPSPSSLARRELRLTRRRVTAADVAWLFRQLATTERAGLPIRRALETIANQRHGTAVGDVVADVGRRLSEGQDLADAFAAHEPTLGAVAVALIAAGAAGGTMAGAFETLATMTEAEVVIRRKVRGALIYPSVVLAVSLVMTLAMLVFVVPTFQGLYAQLNGHLPLATQVLVDLSSLVRKAILVLPVAGIGAAIGTKRWLASQEHRAQVDRTKMRLPVVGGLIVKAAVARVAGTLATLLDAGVTTLVALDMAGDVAGLSPLAMSLSRVAEQIRDGRPLATALAEDGTWPTVMVQLTKVGEDTGQVSELLGRYAEISAREVTAEVDRVVNLIEPLMVLVIGGIVGVTVICLYLPLFDLVNLIR